MPGRAYTDGVTFRPALLLIGLTFFPALLRATPGAAQETAVTLPRLSLIEIDLHDSLDRARLASLELDLVSERHGAWVRAIGWPGTTEALTQAGFSWRILEEDYGAALAAGRTPTLPTTGAGPAAVPPEGSGSMGGFYTLAEVTALLDSLALNDTQGLVSNVISIGTSLQGRPIPAIRIALESRPDLSRPRVLYTALTHAREPEGMQILVHFMKQLISGYGTDPNLTYLVNEREMWFVPVVNPDGYIQNQNTWTSTGSFGLWRKNLRDNDNNHLVNSQDGVDLNRNFGYQWGYDNLGSSPTWSSQTYRGTGPFSEPETSVLRSFCLAKGFSSANNYHTFAEICLYPWSYLGANAPDSTFLIRLSDDLMQDAAYAYGFASQILYPVNGDANDWMYGDLISKPRVFAFTTEAGDQNDGFYPPVSRIPVLAASQDRSNRVLAYAAGTYVRAEDATLVSADGFWHPGLSTGVSVTLRNAGLVASNGGVTVSASTAAAGVTVTDAVSTYAPLAPGLSAVPLGSDLITLAASAAVPAGSRIPLVLTITDGGAYVLTDTVTVVVGRPVTAFSDDASAGLARWIAAGGWELQVVSGDTVFSDSPAGDYAPNADATLSLAAPLDLSGGIAAALTFRHVFDIEGGFDAARVEVSTNGGTSWTSLPGTMTRRGHGATGGYSGGRQVLNEPCYDGTQRFEAPETVDLSAYAGLTDLRLRFRLASDSAIQGDGWRIDEVKVLVYPVDVSAADDVPPEARERARLSTATPNPFANGTSIVVSFSVPTRFRASVHSADGRLVRILAEGYSAEGSRDLYWDGRTAEGETAASGAYFVRLDSGAGGTLTRKVIRIR
jgi:carboxypeptidase T